MVFAWMQAKTTTKSVSLDPTDHESKFYEAGAE
jgi:hypothetical protein